jgi:HSP20 family protein
MLTRYSDIDRTLLVMDELRRRMDRLWNAYDTEPTEWPRIFEGRTVAWPRVNVFDTGASLVVVAEVPGLSEREIQLTINQDVLTLKGERRSDAPDGYSVHRQERSPVRFARSFTLPTKVDPEKTTATVKHGVLTITLPKAPEAQPRQITVRAQ